MNDPLLWIDERGKIKFQSFNDMDKQIFMRSYLENLITTGKIINTSSLPPFINKKMIRIIKTAYEC